MLSSAPSLEAPSPLAWTGERMVPDASDPATELYHWQRYLYFRPWYAGARVLDAACGEGYGTNFAATYASHATGLDLCPETVRHASHRYPTAHFRAADVQAEDYQSADLIVSFETIEHLPDPGMFLRQLAKGWGRVVISTPNRRTHSPGNKLSDRPHNPFHTIEWTPEEFAHLVEANFPGRPVRFLSQASRWPANLTEGLDADAMYTVAVIGEGELPRWPKIGIAIPTCDNADQLLAAVTAYSRTYPGPIKFAIVNNGSDPVQSARLRDFADALPEVVQLIETGENLGYGQGANRGIACLQASRDCDYLMVSNDDVVPAIPCLSELVTVAEALVRQGIRLGAVGPVSNRVQGPQQVETRPYGTSLEFAIATEEHHRQAVLRAAETPQLRGLCLLFTPECLDEVGGFDHRFGLGNYEDDDHNLRCRLAGYSLYIAEGAYLHHHGSQTFHNLGIDYAESIATNASVFCDKWNLSNPTEWANLETAPKGVSIYEPMAA